MSEREREADKFGVLVDRCDTYECSETSLIWTAVSYQGSLSSIGRITVGVPQGSILRLLLFSIYVNDLPNAISSSDVNMFADDTEIHFSHGDLLTVE